MKKCEWCGEAAVESIKDADGLFMCRTCYDEAVMDAVNEAAGEGVIHSQGVNK